MHPYSVWLKTVLNALIKDLRYTHKNHNYDLDCICLFEKISKIIQIELNDILVNRELDVIYERIRSQINEGEGISHAIPTLSLSDEISIYLGNLEIQTEVLARLFGKGNKLLFDDKYAQTETAKYFGERALTNLLRVDAIGSDDDAIDIFADSSFKASEETELEEEPAPEPEQPSDPLLKTWKPAAILFTVISLLTSYTVYRLGLDGIHYLDGVFFALFIATLIWFFFNPRTRYMRVFMIFAPTYIGGSAFLYSVKADVIETDSKFVLSVSNYELTPYAQALIVLVLVILLVLDYLERK